MLLDQLTKQEPGQDRDEGIWNVSMAAGTCLGLVAQCVKDEIVSLVMPYVQVRRYLLTSIKGFFAVLPICNAHGYVLCAAGTICISCCKS